MKKLSLLFILQLFVTCLCSQSSVDKGKTLYEAKKYPEAEKLLKAVAEKTSDYAAAQYYLGRIAFDKKEYDDAVDYFKTATEGNAKEGDYFNWLGDTYAAIGSDAGFLKQMSVGPKAMKAWEKATGLDAKNISARVFLAGAYLQAPGFMGGGADKAKVKATEALKLLDEALMKTPDNYQYQYWYGKTAALNNLRLDEGEVHMKKYVNHTPQGDEPPLANAYLRLAQIMEKKGNKTDAKKYYEMAWKKDSSLDEAKEGLERIAKK